jgi:hypothetical protein
MTLGGEMFAVKTFAQEAPARPVCEWDRAERNLHA